MDQDPRFTPVQELYDRGLYLQALRIAEPLGPLPTWRGAAGRVLAGRLAASVGAGRLAYLLHSLAQREHPHDETTRYFGTWARLRRRGPWAVRQDVLSAPEPTSASCVESRTDWLALRGYVHALFRDFSRANADVDQALALQPERSWLWVERGAVLEQEDRHDEALAAYEKALALRPWYRPAVEARAHALIHANRLDEAVTFLDEACEKLEAWSLFAQRSALFTEREEHAEAYRTARRMADFMPLLAYDKRQQQWLAARLSDAAYYQGDEAAALEWAEKSQAPFHLAIAERLRQPSADRRRVQLAVGFVRQHHLTCAPATLTAISQFWSRPADHLEVTEAICYDGTPSHSERKWAEDQGYVTREFRVTWDVSVALIDADIPFTLTTVEPGSAHLQAVIGYDQTRGTLLVRDPSSSGKSEFRMDGLLKRYAATGPRGMLMAPPEKVAALSSIELPDAELYDACYRIELALRAYRRDEAAAILACLEQESPEHRLTFHAARSLAWYDSNAVQGLAAVDRMLKLFPDDVNLQLSRIGMLRELGRRADRMASLSHCADDHRAHDLLVLELVRDLAADARENARLRVLLRRVLRNRPLEASAISLLADVEWSEQRHAEALELYRLAACVDDKNERHARAFFAAARHLRRTDEALAHLRDRANRYGRRSFWPARTLASAYEQLERTTDAQAVYDEALAQHAEDGQLMLMAARFCITNGFRERGRLLLEQAGSRVARSDWLRTAAAQARAEADLPRSLAYWRELLELEPLATDANETVPELILSVEGEEAALAHVRTVARRFPHHDTIRSVQIRWARRESPTTAEQQLRAILNVDPNDAWARRELASVLLDAMRWDEAEAEAIRSLELDPTAAESHFLAGRACEGRRLRDRAREWFRKALALSIDYVQPFSGLMRIAESRQERVEALQFVAAELARQVTYGDGMLYFRSYAEGTLSREEILALLQQAHAIRPDLWQSWSGLAQQHLECGHLDEALRTVDEGLRRFPLLPRLWLDRADILDSLCDLEGQVAAARRALEIAPGWNSAEHRLAELLERQGRMDEVRGVLESALRHDPLDGANHLRLAQWLWNQDRRSEAVARLRQAVEVDPSHEPAWDALRRWAQEEDQPEIALEPVRQLCERRPHEARSWMLQSDVFATLDRIDDALAALDRALACNPRLEDAYSSKAYFLATQRRFDEALAVCRPAVFGDSPPLMLRSREAQVLALRGDVADGIARMREVVADDPDYAWAWQRLVEWYDDGGAVDEYVEAARQVVRLGPDQALGYGFLGDALARAGQRDDAKATLWRALQISPHYAYGARRLCGLYIEDRQTDQIEQVIELSGSHLPPGFARAYRMHGLLGAGRSDQALAEFRELLAEPLEDGEPVDLALQAVSHDTLRPALLAALAERLEAANALPELAYYWGRQAAVVLSERQLLAQLIARQSQGELGEQALLGCCDELGERRYVLRLSWFRKQQALDLRASDRRWRAMGQALFLACMWRDAVKWFGDWERRTDVQAGDLYRLALSHHGVDQTQRAREIHVRALQQSEDWSMRHHRLMLCLIDAWEARWDDATRSLQELAGETWNEFHALIPVLVRTLLAAQGRLPGEPALKLNEAMNVLQRVQIPTTLAAKLRDKTQVRLALQAGDRLQAGLLWLRSKIFPPSHLI